MKKTDTTTVDTDTDMTTTEVQKPTSLGLHTPQGLGIQGLEDEDASILPIPFVRVVQAMSKDIQTKDGSEALEGSFLFGDTRESFNELHFCILKSKVVVTIFKDKKTGEDKPTQQRKILGITMDTKKVFMLTIATTSFSNYGRLVAEMKQNKITEAWSHIITATTEKKENDNGKFQVVNFVLGEKLTAEDKVEMGLAFEQFKRVFEKEPVEDNKETPIPF